MQRIDAHQHFWRYQIRDYGWISDDMPALKQDRLPADVLPLMRAAKVDACIAVQARQTPTETPFLVELANQYPWIVAVVGWLDLRSDHLRHELEYWQQTAVIKGYRHIVQDEPNPAEFLTDPAFNRGVSAVQQAGKIYEVLIHAKDLAAATTFCARHDQGWLVLDHLGKPAIGRESAADWRQRLQPLAALPHVACKLSGLITEAGPGWRAADINPYLDAALELFGPQRLLFGTDWPVCLLAGHYQQVCELIDNTISGLSPSEQQAIQGANAQRIYHL